MTKDDIANAVLRHKQVFEDMGWSISRSGKVLKYKSFDLSFVMSKYGYEDTYGLSFFLRATNRSASTDKWGNIDPFNDSSQIDFSPYTLKEQYHESWVKLREIYGHNQQLSALPTYFCALDDAMLERVLILVLPLLVKRIEEAEQVQ